ncbi:NAD(P)/FAD-dependent oxidoreductase [Dyella telluris]|uniref:NAD(P)/FAD-dependent oxidoreductase n=1 Tax=Dyella telluris TaxID=2763498 RepID=A0A7G8Q3G0_9GAMM|nr:NAD(P)/FAD-dependent oxidoreductase [Dyella telluris]QNK01318.1 NAD(P)/FAD-dependent oxidoreductase [Dyella telluris]
MKNRILIVGSGFAGMWSALSAARAVDAAGSAGQALEVVVLAPEPRLHVRPRLYEHDLSDVAPSLERLFKIVGVRFVQGHVERIRDADHAVDYIDETGSPAIMPFDRLVLATGSRLHLPPVPGLREHAFNVDQLAGAVRLDSHMRGLVNRPFSAARNTVIVVGGGFTGIETAAEMPARLRSILGPQTAVNVIVIEQADAIGPDLGPGPRPVIEQAFREMGIAMRLGTTVASIDSDGVITSGGEHIPSETVIWTAGVRASGLTDHISSDRDRFGRLHVTPELRVRGSDVVYATGDVAMAATDHLGNVTMMSCQHAMNMGRSAGHNAAAELLNLPSMPYSQPKYVTCLDLGPWGAVYTEGWEREVVLVGPEAKALKQKINTEWIYPPSDDRAGALAAADPARIVVA